MIKNSESGWIWALKERDDFSNKELKSNPLKLNYYTRIIIFNLSFLSSLTTLSALIKSK